MFSYIHSLLPPPFLDLFTRNNNFHNYNTRTASNYRPYIRRTNIKQLTILYQGPKVWNSLPTDITSSESRLSFRKKILTFLINQYNGIHSNRCSYTAYHDKRCCRNINTKIQSFEIFVSFLITPISVMILFVQLFNLVNLVFCFGMIYVIEIINTDKRCCRNINTKIQSFEIFVSFLITPISVMILFVQLFNLVNLVFCFGMIYVIEIINTDFSTHLL